MFPSPQIRVPATYLRGGTSKGVFFQLQDLPAPAQQPGPARDALLLRVLGSPDPYGKQIDGMGNASSSTSKAVILSRSTRPGHDVDYLFGQVSIDKPFVDWSGNCGNLSAAVGPCAIHMGLIDAARIPLNGNLTVLIWQANIGKTIVAHVPITHGQVQETHSVSAGLDYPGVGPEHALLLATGRVRYESASDDEALAAVRECCESEGILPALESAHALAGAKRWARKNPGKRILIGLSGRGDKDMPTLQRTLLAEQR